MNNVILSAAAMNFHKLLKHIGMLWLLIIQASILHHSSIIKAFFQDRLSKQHSAVESVINSLEHHGLDRFPDKGYYGYARYVGLGVLSYNLHLIGNHMLKQRRQPQPLPRAA